MIKVLFVSSTSVCFEWQNDEIYTRKPYTIELDGKVAYEGNTNVFSLFNLCPNTKYTVIAKPDNVKVEFTTMEESFAISVKEFGAVGDGVHDDTNAIQGAINTAMKNSRIIIPAGTYLCRPLTLKSNITIDLQENATILGSTVVEDYYPYPGTRPDAVTGKPLQIATWEGESVDARQSLVGGWALENINIVGRGTIDGNAQNATWWDDPKQKPGRPRLIFLNKCKGVSFHGITGQNAASWQFHPYYSEDLNFLDLRINAPKDSPNTDGLDPEACNNVNIYGCIFSVGDDCIALKSGKQADREDLMPANNHTIRNCLMQFGHGAVTLGSEISGGVTNLTVSHCRFYATDRGLRIKTRRGRGERSIIDGVVFEDIEMEEVLTPIVINMWYNCCDLDRFSEYNWSREKYPVDKRTPYLGDFTFRKMTCKNCRVMGCYVDGLPEQMVKSVTIEDVSITYAEDAEPDYPAMRNFGEKFVKGGLYFDNVKTLTLKNVDISGNLGEKLIIKNVEKIVE